MHLLHHSQITIFAFGYKMETFLFLFIILIHRCFWRSRWTTRQLNFRNSFKVIGEVEEITQLSISFNEQWRHLNAEPDFYCSFRLKSHETKSLFYFDMYYICQPCHLLHKYEGRDHMHYSHMHYSLPRNSKSALWWALFENEGPVLT